MNYFWVALASVSLVSFVSSGFDPNHLVSAWGCIMMSYFERIISILKNISKEDINE